MRESLKQMVGSFWVTARARMVKGDEMSGARMAKGEERSGRRG